MRALSAGSDLAEVIAIAKRRWLVVAFVFLFFVGLAAAASFLSTPVYQIQTVLVPANTSSRNGGLGGSSLGGLGGLAALAGFNLDDSRQVSEAIALLQSRQLTEEFIKERNLLPVLYASQWDQSRNEWRVQGDKIPTLWKAYELFNKKIRKVYLDKDTGLVTLQIEWRDPKAGAEWVSALVSKVNEEMRRRTIDEANKSIAQLNTELAQSQIVSLQQAISQLIQTQVERRMVALVRNEYAFRVLDRSAVPDRDAYVRPRPLLYMAAGVFFGIVAGMIAALFLEHALSALKERP